MGKRITEAKLAELRASVAHCQPLEGLSSEYLKPFAQYSAESKCLCCGEHGTFTWGLVHGEGHCHTCGWPARLYHFVPDPDGRADEVRVIRLLQYHPDGISLKSKAA